MMKLKKKKNDMRKNTIKTENILEENQKKKGRMKNIGREDILQENIKNIEKILKKAEITKFIKMRKLETIKIENTNQKIIQKMIMTAKIHIKSIKNIKKKKNITQGEEETVLKVIENKKTDTELKGVIAVKGDTKDIEKEIQVKKKFIHILRKIFNKKIQKIQIFFGMDFNGSLNLKL
jgi:hypothetical protein